MLLVDPDFEKIHFRLALSFTHLLELHPKTEYFEKANNCFQIATKQNVEDDTVWLEWALMLISYSLKASTQIIKKNIT